VKASDALALYLERHSVNHCFEMTGGMIAHLIDSMLVRGAITITSVHHEQAAAFAAEGIARVTRGREMGLAMGTSGPGATNLITGIGSCWFDSIPCLFITGQVNKSELKGTSGIRQQGFQELDIVSMVSPITKYAVQITEARDLLPELHKAAVIAISGRNGPVLLDITFNAQREEVDEEEALAWAEKPWPLPEPHVAGHATWLSRLNQMWRRSRKPLVLLGGGAVWADSLDRFTDLLTANDVPYASTLMGAQWLTRSPSYLGMIGAYGNRLGNWAVQNCDLLVVVGSRMDVRQTGALVDDFARNATIVQVDIDPSQLNNRVKADLSINCSAEEFLATALGDGGLEWGDTADWMQCVDEAKARLNQDEYRGPGITPSTLFRAVNGKFQHEKVSYVADVGNHQMWAASLLDLGEGQSAHYCGGMGAMGFGLPVSIGVALQTGAKVVNLSGDGSVQVNIHELDTLSRLGLDVTVLVLDNDCLGMIKSFQDIYFEGRNRSSVDGYGHPDFAKVAEAYGIEARSVTTEQELGAALQRAKESSGPMLIDVDITLGEECRPRLAFGGKLDEQQPRPLDGLGPSGGSGT
jgi:acetolactate synthase I/II/III large subunit